MCASSRRRTRLRLLFDLDHVDRRRLLVQFLKRAPILPESSVDLFRVLAVVGEGKLDLAFGQVACSHHRLDLPVILEYLHDLPDIESASDHPGSAVPITSSERDP